VHSGGWLGSSEASPRQPGLHFVYPSHPSCSIRCCRPLPAGYNQGMRYRLRTLLIVVSLMGKSGFCAPPSNIKSLSDSMPSTVVSAADSASERITPVEWSDLAFTVRDRKKFDASQIPDRVRALQGKRIRLRGYFHGGVSSREPTEFLLIGEVKVHPTPRPRRSLYDELPIDQLAAVKMEKGMTASFTRKPVAVTGRLEFEVLEWNGEAFLVFRLIADSVVEVPARSGYGRAMGDGC
jgi:hypothetical protein